MSAIRHPAVAGRFYPDNPQELLSELRLHFPATANPTMVIGCMAPHAGYMYSGHVAAAVYSQIKFPAAHIILCPNHTGKGKALAIMSEGEWLTPLGSVAIDSVLAKALKQKFPSLSEDAEAHRYEHAIEVQLPFIQSRVTKLTFVPIALGTHDFDILHALGEAIAEVISAENKPILLISSSDMNHYESDAVTRLKDRYAMEEILALNARGLFETVIKNKISMCGLAPTIVMLTAARKLGATRAELVRYATSADVSGERERVVGYAGIIVK